ncbi:uncharacterized protein LOC124171040 [Ischnura elegans]|uniref:uncharacterized protein LOC124171040 n=1 Tax=Ischnura elegans TaxID=197161 RepID=UPI001ED8769F|nr:uncharacterized protein LOC124171040 [Ischnura elegans]
MKKCCSRRFIGQAVAFILLAFIICASMYKPMIVKRSYRGENKLSVFLDGLKDQEWYEINCFDGKLHESIGKTPNNLDSWSQAFERKCQILWSKFQRIYSVDVREGRIEYSRDFENKLKSWFHNKEDLVNAMKSQSLIHFRNLYTKEHTIYNPLRSKRPMQKLDKDPKVYVDEISAATRKSCDFCNYKEMTAKDLFDRIEGKHSVTAANAFKIDKWHGLMLTKKHNPSDITEEELVDLFNTTLKWFKRVNREDKSSRFPNILWDSLPHAGASQVHPHVHGLMDTDHYYGILEEQNRASIEYHEATGNNYWEDIIEIHHALGLTKRFGDAIALTSLTSRKDNEVMLISDEPSLDLFRLLYYVIQTYYQRYKIYCHSSGMAFPAFGDMHDSSLPALIRISTRGDCSNVRSDISSLELYTVYNVNADLYEVISNISATVDNFATKSSFNWNPIVPWA